RPGRGLPRGRGPAGGRGAPAAVWGASSLDLTVSRLDPATGRVTATIGVGDGPTAIVAAKDGIWVSNEFAATLDRIYPRSREVVQTIPLGSSPRGMAAAGGGGLGAPPP